MALSPEELQEVDELKKRGVSNTLIMGHIAKMRQGKPSIVSDAVTENKTKQSDVTKRVVSDAPSDIKEEFLGVGEDLTKRGEKVMEAGQARLDGKQGFTRTAFQQLGQVVGGAADIAGRGIMTVGKLFTTPEAEKGISEGVGNIAQETGLVDVLQKLEAYKEANPEKARDIEAGLGILELALDRLGIKYAKKVADIAQEGVESGVDVTKQTVKNVADTVSDIKMPEIQNPAPGLTQTTKEFAQRAPRAVENVRTALTESAERARRINASPTAVGKAIEAKVPDNTIKLVTDTDAPTRVDMRKMIDVAESGERGARPSRVAGEAVANQYKVIDDQRKAVGKQLEEAINNLPDATVDMRLAYQQLDNVLAENGIRVTGNKLDFSQSSLPTQQRTAVQRLYDLTREAGDTMDARMVHAKDRMFSSQKRADMKTDMLDDVFINVNGESKSVYDTFRDIYRNQLDNLDGGSIRDINKQYAILRNAVDEADNSIFKTAKTKGMEIDPEASAMVNLRRIEGDALSTPYFQNTAKLLDDMSRQYGYKGSKPSDLITFAEDLRKMYPDTIPSAGGAGTIRTAIKPGALDLLEKTLNVGKLTEKDQQKALKALLDELNAS